MRVEDVHVLVGREVGIDGQPERGVHQRLGHALQKLVSDPVAARRDAGVRVYAPMSHATRDDHADDRAQRLDEAAPGDEDETARAQNLPRRVADGVGLEAHRAFEQLGQRRGIEIGGQSEPLYVVRIEPDARRLVDWILVAGCSGAPDETIRSLRFTTDFFNIWNHANFANPSTAEISSTAFGRIFSTVGTPRLIQFSLRYSF